MSKKQTSLESFFAKGKGPEETCAQSTDSTATQNQLQTDQNHVKAESKHRWIKRRPNFTSSCRMCPLYSNMPISTRLSLMLIYLFTYICSVRVVLLEHHDAS